MDAKMILPLLLVAVVVGAGCIGQVSPTGEVTQPVQEPQPQPQEQPVVEEPEGEGGLYVPPAGTPSISILSPADGAELSGTSAIGVRVDVQNFRLSGATKELRDNEGQIYASVEGPVTKKFYTPIKVFSFAGLEPGTYTVTAELVDNQKNPIGVSDSVTVTLTGTQ